jgi:uncharacterized protein (DUF169 family)
MTDNSNRCKKGAPMTNSQIIDIIKSTVVLKKEPIALKVWKEEPHTILQYQGNAFPGLCTQIGEVLASGKTFHTNREHCFCTGGVVSTGVAPPVPEEERDEIIRVHASISKSYRDFEIALCYENEMAKQIPPVNQHNAAVQVGLLRDIEQPDVVLIFCSPGVADIVNRAYCYVAGEPVRGFGGNGGCPFLIQYPYVTKKPSFSYSDVAWRKYVGLADEELTMSFPYQSLLCFIHELPDVTKAYRRYGEPVEE